MARKPRKPRKRPVALMCPREACGSLDCVVIGKNALQAVCRTCGTSNTRKRFQKARRESAVASTPPSDRPYYPLGNNALWRAPMRPEDPE